MELNEMINDLFMSMEKKNLNFVNCLMSLCYNGWGFFVMLFFIYCILLGLSYFLCKGIVLVIYEL